MMATIHALPPGQPEPSPRERLAPTVRPAGVPAGYQEWRRLLFLHWPVQPEVLAPFVPPGLTMDLFQGSAYVTLLPFFVQAARPLGAPRALGLAFQETNIRTYVHLGGREPGIYFFSLDAASLLAVAGARVSLGLPYMPAAGWEHVSGASVNYFLQRRLGTRPICHARYEIGESLGPAQPGTLDHFLIERYLLHVERGPTLWTVQVAHQAYPLHRVRSLHVQDQLLAGDGLPQPTDQPLAHYASGVDVEVFPPRIRRHPSTGR